MGKSKIITLKKNIEEPTIKTIVKSNYKYTFGQQVNSIEEPITKAIIKSNYKQITGLGLKANLLRSHTNKGKPTIGYPINNITESNNKSICKKKYNIKLKQNDDNVNNYSNSIFIGKNLKKIIANIDIVIILLRNVCTNNEMIDSILMDTKKIYDHLLKKDRHNIILKSLSKYKRDIFDIYKHYDDKIDIVTKFMTINKKQEELYEILVVYCKMNKH